jgi:hypothetical protein
MTFIRHITPRMRPKLLPAFFATAILAVACTAGPDSAIADDAQTLGEVRLTLTRQPPPPPAEQGPRVALLLIDCSYSMAERDSGSFGGVQRWDALRTGLEQTLQQLQAVSPGVEVQLRFFADRLDCRPPASAKLQTPADVDLLMEQAVPKSPPQNGTTALYESTVACVEEMRRENKQRKFEWWIFGVFSDGANGVDPRRRAEPKTTVQERNAQLSDMIKEGAAEPVVWTVGPEAQKAAKTGEYGQARILELGKSIPAPPPQPIRYKLELANAQEPGIQLDRAAKAGNHQFTVKVEGGESVGTGLIITPRFVRSSPFRLLTNEFAVAAGSSASVELELPANINRDKNTAATLDFIARPSPKSDTISIDGAPQVTFSFTADSILPQDQWTLDHAPAERKGAKTQFAANPGKAESPQWIFTGPNGAAERKDGLVVSHAFSIAGTWTCEFTCADASDPKKRLPPKKAAPIEIIDAAFSIEPSDQEVDGKDAVTFRIVPEPGATSAAEYKWLFDAKDASAIGSLGIDGKTLTLPPNSIGQIGRHTIAAIARSRVGDFDWRNETAVFLKASPSVGIILNEFAEGQDTVLVPIKATGEIGGAVTVFANGEKIADYPIMYSKPGVQVEQVEAKIPTADIKKPELVITVRPKKEGACPEATATLKGRAADVHAKLKSPASGSKVSLKGGRQIVLEPAGDNADDVGDIDFEVALVGEDEAPKDSGLLADEANRWTVAIPRRPHLGKTVIYAKPVGGHLRPDLFPREDDGWKKIGMLEIVPDAKWVPFLLSLLGILAFLYFTWTAIEGNEARYWEIQTALRKPKPNDDGERYDGSVSLLRLQSGEDSTELSGESALKPYKGWPYGNWWPRMPQDFFSPFGSLEGKTTAVYLWQLATGTHKKWLHKAVSRDPNREIVINGKMKRDPFENLPDVQDGDVVGWKKENPFDEWPAGDAFYSKTYRLSLSGKDEESLWIRMRQPKKHFFWEHYAFAALVLAAAFAVYQLLRLFNCISN